MPFLRKILMWAILFTPTVSNSQNFNTSPDGSSAQLYSTAETKASYTPLRIGDKVPEVFFKKIINYKREACGLFDLKGKLLILDFWSTWCSSCIKAFPKMDFIQKSIGDRLLIMTVGFNSGDNNDIEDFINKRKGTSQEMSLPTIVQTKSDSILRKLFPSVGFPHEVWIDSTGTVIALTGAAEVNKENISSVLRGEELKLPSYKMPKLFDPANYYISGEKRKEDFVNGIVSIFTPYNDSLTNMISFGTQIDSTSKNIFLVNTPVLDMYCSAYSSFNPGHNFKRILINAGSTHFYKNWDELEGKSGWEVDKFMRENLFCYQLVTPKDRSTLELQKYMIADLDKYLKISSHLEKRQVVSLGLYISDERKINYSKQQKIVYEFGEPKQLKGKFRNITLNKLADFLDSRLKAHVFDKTNCLKPIDLDLDIENPDDMMLLKEILKKNGLELRETVSEIDFLILSKNE